MVRNRKVAERIAALKADNRERSAIEREDVIRFLVEVIQTPAGKVGPESRLCQEVRETVNGAGVSRSIKMPGKLDAVRELAKLLGWYEPERLNCEISDPLTALVKEIRSRR